MRENTVSLLMHLYKFTIEKKVSIHFHFLDNDQFYRYTTPFEVFARCKVQPASGQRNVRWVLHYTIEVPPMVLQYRHKGPRPSLYH